MYCRLTSIRFSRGRSMPAMRAIRCLSVKRGPLSLALLVTGVGRADDPHDALAPHHLALVADLLHRRADLHETLRCRSKRQKHPPRRPAGLAAEGHCALRLATRILRGFPGKPPVSERLCEAGPIAY